MTRFGAFGPQAGGTYAELSRRIFRKLDGDRSGMLSREEVTRSGVLQKLGVAKSLDEVNSMFDGADVNKDGKLSPLESQVMFTNMMVHKPEVAALIAMMTADEAREELEGDITARTAEEPAPTPEELEEQTEAAEPPAPPAAAVIWRQVADAASLPQPELNLTA